ncbi:MAG TPA: response regulator [Bryobacteraceae bacterium]|nr:response regulator [Bryobacteraceae bacterium]
MADDSEAVIREIELLMADDFEIVGKAATGLALVEQAMRLRPDLIVTDFEMPGMDGLRRAARHSKSIPANPLCSSLPTPTPTLRRKRLKPVSVDMS